MWTTTSGHTHLPSLGWRPTIKTARSSLWYLKKLPTGFPDQRADGFPHHHAFPPATQESTGSSTSVPAHELINLFNFRPSRVVVARCGCNLHFLDDNSVEHLLWACVPSTYLLWWNACSDLLPIFIRCFDYLLLNLALYICWTQVLPQTHDVRVFSTRLWLHFFHSLNSVFWRQKWKIFILFIF